MGITPAQYEQLKNRVVSRRPVPSSSPFQVAPPLQEGQKILGLDPSLRGTGYGVIKMTKTGPVSVNFGVIVCPPNWERSRCLVKIVATLRQVLVETSPTVCAMESLFYAQNFRTTLVLGEARGAALATIAEAGVTIFEIAPRKVKQAVVGFGAADKFAVAKMVQRLLQLSELPAPDAADALALALAHAQQNKIFRLSTAQRI